MYIFFAEHFYVHILIASFVNDSIFEITSSIFEIIGKIASFKWIIGNAPIGWEYPETIESDRRIPKQGVFELYSLFNRWKYFWDKKFLVR